MLYEATADAQYHRDNIVLILGWLVLMAVPAGSIVLTALYV